MGMLDARGACHGTDGRYATAATCRGSGLSEEGAIVLGVIGGAALVGLVAWLAARATARAPGGAAAALAPMQPDRLARTPQAEAADEARSMGQEPLRRCMDTNGTVVVVRALCSERGLRNVDR